MGSAAARALGSHRRTRPRLHLAVQYSFRNGDRRLHHVGSSSQPSGTGIRGNGGRSHRLRCRNRSSLMWAGCEDSRPSTSLMVRPRSSGPVWSGSYRETSVIRSPSMTFVDFLLRMEILVDERPRHEVVMCKAHT